MQPKNKRKRILRTNASVSGPIKVRNLKTGELAIYTPDKLQPTIPAGWVPLNSNRQQSRAASRNFRRNSGLVVQTCGNQYRILNSSRKVVAQGKLNAAVGSDDHIAVDLWMWTRPGFRFSEGDAETVYECLATLLKDRPYVLPKGVICQGYDESTLQVDGSDIHAMFYFTAEGELPAPFEIVKGMSLIWDQYDGKWMNNFSVDEGKTTVSSEDQTWDYYSMPDDEEYDYYGEEEYDYYGDVDDEDDYNDYYGSEYDGDF